MATKSNDFVKIWSKPILLFVVTIIGLLLAIIGTGIWHVLSWIALIIPIYVMVSYGARFFK
ncbi:hypothetical protein GCM10007415_19150 [Parapedobacter pyrenivorans]|uniref:Uncharacterized protein n=1 Tax=Parapedobacter pyrenivorans TaxID=1305674 RepID=A0A917HP62_9SPHI|nr:hypothetical protein GCM10007415_19150 [Parapedobacter pyrenivorans]